jgi:hypothetical protein
MYKFVKAVAAFVALIGISRDEYKTFFEVVCVLRFRDDEVYRVATEFKTLKSATLRDRMHIRQVIERTCDEVDTTLKVEKLPTA